MFVAIAGQVVLLTHIDSVCKKKDLSDVFHNKEVDNIVKEASQLTGLPSGDICPVKNYVSEQDLNTNMDILLLLALQKIVNYSIDNIIGLKENNSIS